MIGQKTFRSLVVSASILTLTVAGAAWAHGPERGGFEPSGPLGMRPGGYPGGLLLQLVYPCQTDCIMTARSCNDTADSDALSCVSGACANEITTAQSACAADQRAQACLDAVNALRTCAQSCLSTRQTALMNCRDTLGVCRQACGPTPTPTP